MNSNDNSNKGFILGFGLLAGIAIGYYLNSNEGRAARRRAQVRFDEYGNQITEYSHQVSQQVSQKANHLTEEAKKKLEEGKNWAGETADSIKSTITDKATALRNTATETVHSVEDSFKRGVNKAKANIDSGKA